MSTLISTKGRYATRIMLDLAIFATDGPVATKDISKRTGIAVKYLESIMSTLGRAGMIRSTRGAQGGYTLTKSPSKYTIGDIVRVAEGDIAAVQCTRPGAEPCENADTCTTLKLWKMVDRAVNDVLDGTTLEDLVSIERHKNMVSFDMYEI